MPDANAFDFTDHDEDDDGEDMDMVDVDLMTDTSDEDEDELLSEDDEKVETEVLNAGEVQESDNESLDITPVKKPAKPAPKSKPKPKPKKTIKVLPTKPSSIFKSQPKPLGAKSKESEKIVDVSKYTRAKVKQSSGKDGSFLIGDILPQPTTVENRVNTNKKKSSAGVSQQILKLIDSGDLTRDNCVKVVTFNHNGDPSGSKTTFEYHFGVWTVDGELQSINVAQEKLLNSADFKNKNLKTPHQTPVKWIRDKNNMLDPESFHIIHHEGQAFNVPMPICSTKYFVSITAENIRAKKKQANNKAKQIVDFVEKAKNKNITPIKSPKTKRKRKEPETAPAKPVETKPAEASPVKKPRLLEKQDTCPIQDFFDNLEKKFKPNSVGTIQFFLQTKSGKNCKRLVSLKSCLVQEA